MTTSKKWKLALLSSVIFFIGTATLAIVFRVHSVYLGRQVNESRMELNTALVAHNNAVDKEARNIINTDLNNADTHIAEIAKQNSIRNNVNTTAKKFFSAFYTFNSGEQYSNRSSLVKGVATQEVTDNKNLFDSGLDSTGHSIVDALKLNSEFISLNTQIESVNGDDVASIVRVVYYGKYDSTQSQSDNGFRYYEVHYSISQGKLTSVNSLVSGLK